MHDLFCSSANILYMLCKRTSSIVKGGAFCLVPCNITVAILKSYCKVLACKFS